MGAEDDLSIEDIVEADVKIELEMMAAEQSQAQIQ
jgi:hypothetical protein